MTIYHHPEIETMPKKQLDVLQEKLLRKICDHAWDAPFYREFWSRSGFDGPPTNASSFSRLPFVTKQHILDSFPYGMCALPRDQLVRVHITSGSSGRPAAILLSMDDVDRHAEIGVRSLVTRGVRAGDVYQMTLAYGLWAAGFSGHYAAERLGCLVIPAGPGNTQRQIWLMKALGTTVLNAVPSYHLRIADVGEEMGVDFASLPLRIGLSTAGRLEPATRKEIEERLDVEMYDCYGMTEVGGIGYECQAHDGLHVWHDQICLEVVDASGETVTPGESGELVVTSLSRFALPLIRFRTGDKAMLLSDEPCSCGRTHMKISNDISRLDDAVKVKGVLFSPQAVERHIKRLPELSGDFLIQVRPKSHPLLICELRSSVKTEYRDDLETAVATELKNKIGLTFDVRIVGFGELPAERGEKRIQVIPDLGA